MGQVRKTISVDTELDDWVQEQVALGRYASSSEVYRAAVDRARYMEAQKARLDSLIEEGFASGMSANSLQDMMDEAMRKAKSMQTKAEAKTG